MDFYDVPYLSGFWADNLEEHHWAIPQPHPVTPVGQGKVEMSGVAIKGSRE